MNTERIAQLRAQRDVLERQLYTVETQIRQLQEVSRRLQSQLDMVNNELKTLLVSSERGLPTPPPPEEIRRRGLL
jgi:septal ring factor EnvC (AmiA/AmiB activator)